MYSEIKKLIDVGDREVYVTFFGNFKYEDKGIGDYEFWGQRGYDEHIVIVAEYIDWAVSVDISVEEEYVIEDYLRDNLDSLEEELVDRL